MRSHRWMVALPATAFMVLVAGVPAASAATAPYCGITWNPPGAQTCANCRNQLPPPQASYSPPGFAPGETLGVDAGLGKSLGLDERWASRVIEQVGNYGEVFNRNLGAGSPLRIERGLNALWMNGGLIYAPPLR